MEGKRVICGQTLWLRQAPFGGEVGETVLVFADEESTDQIGWIRPMAGEGKTHGFGIMVELQAETIEQCLCAMLWIRKKQDCGWPKTSCGLSP